MNNKKIVLEIIGIPLCIVYLVFLLLKSPFVSLIVFTVLAIITAIWFSPKYINEVYIYKSKSNLLKLTLAISDILLAIISLLALIFKLKLFKIIMIVLSVVVFLQLIVFTYKNLREIIKKKNDFGINILYSFGSFLILSTMIATFVIYLK